MGDRIQATNVPDATNASSPGLPLGWRAESRIASRARYLARFVFAVVFLIAICSLVWDVHDHDEAFLAAAFASLYRSDKYWLAVQALFLSVSALAIIEQYRSSRANDDKQEKARLQLAMSEAAAERTRYTVDYLRAFDLTYFAWYSRCTFPTMDPREARKRAKREYLDEVQASRLAIRSHSVVYPFDSIQLAFLHWHNFCVHIEMWSKDSQDQLESKENKEKDSREKFGSNKPNVLERDMVMQHLAVVFVRSEYILREVLVEYERETKNEPKSLRALCAAARHYVTDQIRDKYPENDDSPNS